MSALSAAVVLASAGRPALLAAAMRDVDAQTHQPAQRILSVPDAASLPGDTSGWTAVIGTRGLAAQRNAGLDAVERDIDVVLFFDDDAVVRADYVARALDVFENAPAVVGLTGRVLLDGAAHSAGEVSVQDANAALAASWEAPLTGATSPRRTLYGCNFAVSRSLAQELRFDDRLPLYSWLEDHDFARRLQRHGTLVRADDCVIVHRGATSGGRTNHVRLGYSQFMNPVYLARAGSFPVWLSAWEIFRPVARNLALAAGGAQAPWRRERVRGNALAFRDAVRGRITPERIVEL
ncbi:glycosyltransferase family 2 protein [Demequina sp. SO4-18]|uniref:glycosyltransferase family 2 protein n=1 Tax=Demequina sp. SO4-18 TaxID=3401026 RepID=UPI003B5C4ADC